MLHRFLSLAGRGYSVEVEEQGNVKAVQTDVRVVLRRVSAVEFSLARGRGELLAEVVVSARATAEDPRATPGPGAGLGLAIAKCIIERQGGRLSFDASATRGARFVMEFPQPVA